VKNWPALIRFFQKIATAGQPSGRNSTAPLALPGFVHRCQLPDRIAAIRSANFRDNSTDASSKATLDRMTHP